MRRQLTLLALLALVTASMAGEYLACPADQTEVKTGYIYDASGRYGSCPRLVGATTDWFKVQYRLECQRWQGAKEPPVRVPNAYISECHQYENGTLRYRAEVCCEGTLQTKRCFTCTNATDHYSCNYHGTVETCNTGEICSTQFKYFGSLGKICPRHITKGCMAAQACHTIEDENPSRCKTYIDNPRCAFCHDQSLGNRVTSTANRYSYCSKNPCAPNPCKYGTCEVDDTVTSGYKCTCHPWAWTDNTDICVNSICEIHKPCQNNGECSHHALSPPAPNYSCCCRLGWTGVNCTESASGCGSNPGYCKNGGTCSGYGTAGLRCKCPTGWVGEQCESSNKATCMAGSTNYQSVSTFTSRTSTRNCSTYRWPESDFLLTCSYAMKRANGPLFKYGVHGMVSKLAFNGLESCESGEKCFWFKAHACCPSCMSAPCQNGGMCVQKADGDFVCRCRSGYGGRFCESRLALCYTWGDPHTTTFDRRAIHYQGVCKYNFASPSQQYPGLPYFEVLAKNKWYRHYRHVSTVYYMEVKVFGHTIVLERGKGAFIDGVRVYPDVSYPGFELTYRGSFFSLQTNFSLVVEYDLGWTTYIRVPPQYRDKMGGLCGNYDGNGPNDMRTKEGKIVTTYAEVGDSWRVYDNDTVCMMKVDTMPPCDPARKTMVETNDYCGYIKDPAGPFSVCIAGDKSASDEFFSSCVFDTCQDPTTNLSCEAVKTFATHCIENGYPPALTWRTDVKCPLTCDPGMQFKTMTSACHVTCMHPLAETECKFQNMDACKCPEGKVLHQDTCQNPSVCGCTDEQGVVHQIGDTWLDRFCTTQYECQLGTTGWGVVTTLQENYQCPAGHDCRMTDNVPGCQQNIPPANWSPWGEWGDCSMPYRTGTQTRTRRCDNPSPSPGGQPCVGSTTDSRLCQCPPFDDLAECRKCDETNNPAGFLPDPCSCDHFYHCYKVNGLWVGAKRQECAPCTCWNQDKLTCVRDQSKTLADCTVVPIVEEETVSDGVVCTRGAHTFRAVETEPGSFDWNVMGVWMLTPCPPGTVFDVIQCQCIMGSNAVIMPTRAAFCLNFDLGWDGFDTDAGVWVDDVNVARVMGGLSGYAGKFNGINSKIEIPYFTNNELTAFTFSLWFNRNAAIEGEQWLVYNGDCDEEGSIQIRSESSGTVGAGIWADGDLRKVFTEVTAGGNTWHHLVLTYDGKNLKFYVNTVLVQVIAKTTGTTRSNNCPLVLGTKYNGGFFSGLIDEVCFYAEAMDQAGVDDLYNDLADDDGMTTTEVPS